jgi:trigger factor
MEVTLLAEDGLKKEFNVVIDKEAVAKEIDLQIAKIQKDIKVEGFRPGKVPISIIKQRYLPNILQKAMEELVETASSKLLVDRNLKPATQPKVELVQFEENGVLEYKFSMEIMPEIMVPNFADITLNKLVCEANEEEFNNYLETLLKHKTKFVSIAKEAAELGDTLIIDYEGSIDNVLFAGGAAKNAQLTLGSKSFIDNFEEQLVGSKIGDEKTVKVKFPQQYHAKDLAGKEAEFAVKVHDIMQSTTPELTDELAKEFGAQDSEDLKKKCYDIINSMHDDASKKKAKKDLFDQLESMCAFEVPATMVEKEFNFIWQKVLDNNEQDQENIKETYQRLAKRRVLLGLLIAQVAQNDQITVTPANINDAIFKQARNYPGNESQVLDYYRNNPQSVEQLRNQILEEKTVDHILTKVNYIDQVLPTKEFYEAAEINGEDF